MYTMQPSCAKQSRFFFKYGAPTQSKITSTPFPCMFASWSARERLYMLTIVHHHLEGRRGMPLPLPGVASRDMTTVQHTLNAMLCLLLYGGDVPACRSWIATYNNIALAVHVSEISGVTERDIAGPGGAWDAHLRHAVDHLSEILCLVIDDIGRPSLGTCNTLLITAPQQAPESTHTSQSSQSNACVY